MDLTAQSMIPYESHISFNTTLTGANLFKLKRLNLIYKEDFPKIMSLYYEGWKAELEITCMSGIAKSKIYMKNSNVVHTLMHSFSMFDTYSILYRFDTFIKFMIACLNIKIYNSLLVEIPIPDPILFDNLDQNFEYELCMYRIFTKRENSFSIRLGHRKPKDIPWTSVDISPMTFADMMVRMVKVNNYAEF